MNVRVELTERQIDVINAALSFLHVDDNLELLNIEFSKGAGKIEVGDKITDSIDPFEIDDARGQLVVD
jgi:hypothetical protein